MPRLPHLPGIVFALLLSVAAPCLATDHQIEVGGTLITLPVDDDYVPVSPASQQLHQFAQAALPPELRLVETFHTPANLAAIERGESAEGHYLMVQVMRQIEPMVLSDTDWKAMLPGITAGMASADLVESDADRAARDARMSAAAGADVAMRFGQMEKPTIYMTTPDGVRFVVRIPVTMETPNGRETVDVGAAGAIVRVRQKALFLYWYAMPGTPESIAAAQQKLDETLTAMLAANADGSAPALADADAGDGDAAAPAGDAAPSSLTPEDAAKYGRIGGLVAFACIGVVALLIVALVVFLVRRKKN